MRLPTTNPHPDTHIVSLLTSRAIAYTRERGGDADGLIRRFGLSPTVESDPLSAIPWPDLLALLDAAAIEADDPALGVHMAEQGGRDGIAILEFVCSGVPDLRAALDRYARYIGSWNPQLGVSVERKGRGAVITQRMADRPLGLGPHGNQHWVASLLVSARRVTGAPCLAERVLLAHPAREIHPELLRVAGTSRIEAGAGFNAVEVSGALLDTRLRHDRAPISPLLARYAAFAAAERPASGPLDGRVREAIREALESGLPTIGVVARHLGVSARTLQRKLAGEGRSFVGVVEALRQDLALAYAETSSLSVGEIADRLGYAQTSAFLRAFKRWTGTTPKRLRAGEAPAPPPPSTLDSPGESH